MAKTPYKTDTAFGKWLDRCMSMHDPPLDQIKVASLIGVGQSVVSKWRRGAPQPKRKDVVKIAEALGVNVDEALFYGGFIGSNPTFVGLDDDKQRLLALYDNTPPQDRNRLIKIAELMSQGTPGEMQPGEMDELPDD